MSKKKIKPRKLVFFATVLYGMLMWCLLFVCLFGLLLVSDLGSFGYIIIGVAGSLALGVAILRRVRRKSLSLKLKIEPQNIPYTSDELKHYLGLQSDDNFSEEYFAMVRAYHDMRKSKMVQIITSSEENRERRSAAKHIIESKNAKLETLKCPVLYLKQEVPTLLDVKRNIYYLFPHFVIRVAGKRDIIAFSYADFDLSYSDGSYILGYDEKVPKDAEVIGRAYEYTNVDGSPDARVKDNSFTLEIRTGNLFSEDFDIKYQLSNDRTTEEFYDKFNEFAERAIHAEKIKDALKKVSVKAQSELNEEDCEDDSLMQEENPKEADTKQTSSQEMAIDPYKELSSLVGLEGVKKEIKKLANLVKVQQARDGNGLKNSTMSYHLVFTGNPGTGKTTIARIIGMIYKDLGILKKGHLIEADRSGLVAGYLGQTAVKTNEIIDSALDGVLFIDEAYTLTTDDYGKEAIATLLKRMEDDRNRLVVIVAGYTEDMEDFIKMNPGLQSRFNRYIEFPDYSIEELCQIFENYAQKSDYVLAEGVKDTLRKYFEEKVANKDENFGNARLVRNMFEKTIEKQASRLAEANDLSTMGLSVIEKEDIELV